VEQELRKEKDENVREFCPHRKERCQRNRSLCPDNQNGREQKRTNHDGDIDDFQQTERKMVSCVDHGVLLNTHEVRSPAKACSVGGYAQITCGRKRRVAAIHAIGRLGADGRLSTSAPTYGMA
jgi:hypothetical protein